MVTPTKADLKNPAPTLFLDFDGPLHSVEIQAINRYGEFVPHPDLFSGVPILDELLKPFPSIQIVVSSDWRLVVDDDTLKKLLGPLAPRFVGVMEVMMVSSRADAIKEDARRRRLSAWLAIDDQPPRSRPCRARLRGQSRMGIRVAGFFERYPRNRLSPGAGIKTFFHSTKSH